MRTELRLLSKRQRAHGLLPKLPAQSGSTISARAARLRLLAPALRRALQAAQPAPGELPLTPDQEVPAELRRALRESRALAAWFSACYSPADGRLLRIEWIVV